MRFFYDTEFNPRGPGEGIDLVSIAMVGEDGRTYFACNAGFDEAMAVPFVRDYVVPLLPARGNSAWRPASCIATDLLAFVGADSPELWGDFAAYDHVLLGQLFGSFENWPRHWPMFTCDVQQWRIQLGVSNLPELDKVEPWVWRRIEENGYCFTPDRRELRPHDARGDALLAWARWLILDDVARAHLGNGTPRS